VSGTRSPKWILNTSRVPQSLEHRAAEIVDQYVSVWNQPDDGSRRAAVAGLWNADGVEFVEGAAFRGHDELNTRIASAHREFVADGRYEATAAADVSRHDDLIMFTLQLMTGGGEIAWTARVFLLIDTDGLIREDYQLTVQPMAAED
jgi:hypothetical protein